MKKFSLLYSVLLIILLLVSCSTDDKPINQVLDNVQRGAILREIELTNPTFDFLDTSKSWSVNVEVQDSENGLLVSDIKVLVTFVNDGVLGTETLVKTIPVSTFSTGPNGLPVGDVSLTLQETLDGLDLVDGDYDSADYFNIRLVALLTDGREFSSTNSSGTVLSSAFLNSTFLYSAQFFCDLADASTFDGNYVVVIDAWADYAPGDIVPVQFISGYTFRILSTNNPYILNTGTSYLEVTIDPTDASATFASNECFDYSPVGWVCTDVEGTGSVGTCTGDIELFLNFAACCPPQKLKLSKQ